MALFVEVTSVEKQCSVIVNLDHIVEIAPLTAGGCALFLTDGAGMNSRTSLTVKEGYDLFKQFAMQTVTAEDIARRFPKADKAEKPAEKPNKKTSVDNSLTPLEIPKL